METKKITPNNNSNENTRQQIKEAVNQLTDLFIQVCIVKNILCLLDDFLEKQDKEITEPASVLPLCISQLEYAHKQSADILDTIIDCCKLY